jgi:hypothetical protein
MMSKASKLLLIFLLLLSKQALSNNIDDLKTDRDVNEFVKAINPEFVKDKYVKFEIRSTDSIAKDLSCNGIFESWHIRNWEKADITNDGLTDLVFVAHWSDYISYALIDKGDNNFELIRFSKNPFEHCELIKAVKEGLNNYVKIFRKTLEPDTANKELFNYKEVIIIDTLVYKFNDFIELGHSENIKNDIESIQINTSTCDGTCPAFILKLSKNGTANFEGIAYTKHLGKSSKRLPKASFKEISAVANYIDVRSLKDNYEVAWTDYPTATLTVKFTDQSTKVIRDYGLQGTFGLSAIYSKMMKIGTEWK